jgi:hypothetical protein
VPLPCTCSSDSFRTLREHGSVGDVVLLNRHREHRQALVRVRAAAPGSRPDVAICGSPFRVRCLGSLGDGGETIRTLRREHNFVPRSLDLVFIDHDENSYLPDLELIFDEGWLHPGSVVEADNIRAPGAPAYRAYMRGNDGTLWHTTEHRTHVEYQSVIKDLVLESDYLGTQTSRTGLLGRTER